MNCQPTFRRRRAFTLIEIMVAIAIFMLVIAAIYSTWELVMRATKVGQEAAARAQRERVVLRTIENSLMGIQSFQAAQKYYWFGVENGSAPVLSFVSHVPEIFPRNGKFINLESKRNFNLRRLTFTLQPGMDGQNSLVLRQCPVLMDPETTEQFFHEQSEPLELARDVKTFSVECWDTNQLEWVDEWDDTNSIPRMLRVNLVFGGGNGAPDFSASRIIAVPSSMMPAMLQARAPAGLPGANPGLQLPVPVPIPKP